MRRSPAPPLRRRSVAWRVTFLTAGWIWAGAVLAFYYGYHLAQPSSPWAQYDGHTYYTHPPAQTLAQGDHVSAEIVTIALSLVVGIATIDLLVRLVRRMTAPGVAALAGGGLLMLFSLFGLLRGLAGIGTVGLLVLFSGLPMRTTATASSGPAAPRALPASWYADPTGRNELRYWDGTSWSSHVATGGRSSADPV